MAKDIGLPWWYRVKLYFGPAGQQLGMIQRRVFFFFSKDWTPAVNAHRRAMHKFIEHYEGCLDALGAVDRTKDDNQRAIEVVAKHRLREGISQWYEGEPMDREEELPDPTTLFEEYKKKFLSGKSGGNRGQRLRTPDHATRSMYHLKETPLPHTKVNLDELDHMVPYDSNRRKERENQNRNKNRGKSGGNQGQHRDIRISLDDD